ncbi:hypothetical protein [Patulibacter defluvii]|uniref:hypothetical protein n=1 Tax=Patulibacter defluvii TaxID=3095358 RepID=UPI002A75E24B|nr:hypothetical protein [Patulibacter sp. DM4]
MFCRHGRREDLCPICAREKKKRTAPAGGGASRAPRSSVARPPQAVAEARASARKPGSGVRVRKLARHADDGWRSELLPGVVSSRDALELCRQLVRAQARLTRLAQDPLGPYATAAELAGGDEAAREQATWLLFQVAYYGPVEGEHAFVELARLSVGWDEPLPDEETLRTARIGPRGAHEHDRGPRTLQAYREWAARSGGQLAGLQGGRVAQPDAARRFDAAFRALSLPGFGRGPRFEFLLSLAGAGLLDAAPWSLLLDPGRDPVTVAAKRAVRTDDGVLLQRRIGALAREIDLPIAAFDLGLRNWDAQPKARLTGGVPIEEDPDEVALAAQALGIDVGGEDADGDAAATGAGETA